MSRYVQIGQAVIDQFPVWADDGYTKVSGVTDFDVTVWKDGVEVSATVTIAEIGTSGEYRVELTPNLTGIWMIEVFIPLNKDVWGAEYNVVRGSEEDVEIRFTMADNGLEIEMACWVEVDGQRITAVTSATATVKDRDGVVVKDLGTNNSPSSDGTFSFVATSDLTSHRAYFIAVSVTDGDRTWYANKGFATG